MKTKRCFLSLVAVCFLTGAWAQQSMNAFIN